MILCHQEHWCDQDHSCDPQRWMEFMQGVQAPSSRLPSKPSSKSMKSSCPRSTWWLLGGAGADRQKLCGDRTAYCPCEIMSMWNRLWLKISWGVEYWPWWKQSWTSTYIRAGTLYVCHDGIFKEGPKQNSFMEEQNGIVSKGQGSCASTSFHSCALNWFWGCCMHRCVLASALEVQKRVIGLCFH